MLKLKKIFLGTTDAKNEVLSSSPDEISRFMNAFVTPPALNVVQFIEKKKYYVVGLKGTGKTALLRYISLKLEEIQNSFSNFILFKSELDEDLKKDLAKAARVEVVSENSEDLEGDEFEPVWRWFIYKKIASIIQTTPVKPFQQNADLASFLAIVSSEFRPHQDSLFNLRQLVPSIRKGVIEISKTPKLGLELDWDSSGKGKIRFNDLVRRADAAFENLSPDLDRLNIFFDELELNYGTSKQYQRDSRLVRDLIVSIEKINALAKRKSFNICLYAAVRSEVLSSVSSLGKEINKPMTDFGATIIWNRPGLTAAQQPLLSIIEQRINNAREASGLVKLSPSDLWQDYFPEKIHGNIPQVYILHNSWYRPRDVIRLLLSVQDQYPEDTKFNIQGLEAVRKSYSTASWVEITEELKAKYKPSEVDGVKYIFYGFKQISSLEAITRRAEEIAEDHQETRDLLKRSSVKEILKDMYRIGVIGNIDKHQDRMRFSFRGDDEILFDQNIFIHNALRAHLSV